MLLSDRNYSLFDQMFRDPFFERTFDRTSMQTMKTDIHEKDNQYVITMELPGFSKEDIHADLKNGYLTITASHEENKEEKDERGVCIHHERYTGSCNRSFYVGDNLTREDVKAAFQDGMLKLSFPKGAPKAIESQPKYIPIE